MDRTAILSPCGRFRQRLRIRWADGRVLLVIGLNPSRANEERTDASTVKVEGLAKREGFGAFEWANLYPFIATDPADLRAAGYPLGDDADLHLRQAIAVADAVAVAWGANAHGLARPAEVLSLLRQAGARPLCWGTTKQGHPRHPLYLSGATALRPFGG